MKGCHTQRQLNASGRQGPAVAVELLQAVEVLHNNSTTCFLRAAGIHTGEPPAQPKVPQLADKPPCVAGG